MNALDIVRAAEHIEALAAIELYNAAPPEFAAEAGLKTQWFGATMALTAKHIDWMLFNRVFALGLDQPVTETLIEELHQHYIAYGNEKYALQLTPLIQPTNTAQELQNRGYHFKDNWTRFVRGADAPPPVKTDMHVELIGKDYREICGTIISEAFGAPDILTNSLIPLMENPNWYHLMTCADDQPAAAASLFIHDDIGWLGFAGTLDKHRRQGAQSALIRRRIEIGLDHGVKLFVTEVQEDTPQVPNSSDHNLRRLGFQALYPRANWLSR